MYCYHEFLVEEPDPDKAIEQVVRFFRRYRIVSPYDLNFLPGRSKRSDEPGFIGRLDDALNENRKVLLDFITELKDGGVKSMDDLAVIEQGYLTKILHTITHMVDGFFGVDTYFFNLIDDSHWISEARRQRILGEPGMFRLVGVEASYVQEGKGFEKESVLGRTLCLDTQNEFVYRK